jgi:hypothetical protein
MMRQANRASDIAGHAGNVDSRISSFLIVPGTRSSGHRFGGLRFHSLRTYAVHRTPWYDNLPTVSYPPLVLLSEVLFPCCEKSKPKNGSHTARHLKAPRSVHRQIIAGSFRMLQSGLLFTCQRKDTCGIQYYHFIVEVKKKALQLVAYSILVLACVIPLNVSSQ